MPRWRFETDLVRPEGVGTWTFAPIPFNLAKELGTRGRIRVRGTVDGEFFACSLMPAGGGRHFIVVKKSVRDAIGKQDGDTVTIEMDLDSKPVIVPVPSDLVRALKVDRKAREYFDNLAPSHKKNYVAWIEGAKKPETRRSRVNKAVAMLSQGKLAK